MEQLTFREDRAVLARTALLDSIYESAKTQVASPPRRWPYAVVALVGALLGGGVTAAVASSVNPITAGIVSPELATARYDACMEIQGFHGWRHIEGSQLPANYSVPNDPTEAARFHLASDACGAAAYAEAP